MAIITRFGGSGGGTPIVDPYPHVWECTVVQSGTTGVVSGVVSLEAYDILHYTMPLGFSTYDLMIGGVTYHTSFRNEGEMYIQWTGSDFVVVSANAACALPHVWVNPTYTITGTVLEITAGVDDLHTNDVIELTLASGESASNIEYNSQVYTIDLAISEGTNYVQFNGTSFNNALFNFKGNATVSDVASGKTFYSSDGTLKIGSASLGGMRVLQAPWNITDDGPYTFNGIESITRTYNLGDSSLNRNSSEILILFGNVSQYDRYVMLYNGNIYNDGLGTLDPSEFTITASITNGILSITYSHTTTNERHWSYKPIPIIYDIKNINHVQILDLYNQNSPISIISTDLANTCIIGCNRRRIWYAFSNSTTLLFNINSSDSGTNTHIAILSY